jgi:hypothetical protein
LSFFQGSGITRKFYSFNKLSQRLDTEKHGAVVSILACFLKVNGSIFDLMTKHSNIFSQLHQKKCHNISQTLPFISVFFCRWNLHNLKELLRIYMGKLEDNIKRHVKEMGVRCGLKLSDSG